MKFLSILLCFSNLSLVDAANVSQVIIALANVVLASFVIIQIRQFKKIERQTILLQKQNIKLQWFKELIIQPNIKNIFSFYDSLETLKEKIHANLSEEEIILINRFINDCASHFRKSFYGTLYFINSRLHDKIENNIDDLVTKLTEAISNDKADLTNPNVYTIQISNKISNSKSTLLGTIYNFDGLT